ncbi:unnamed protein product [Prorocentrum cordatum]|uniref:Cilia- and flagella-associated protein 157 n=1 Tax=Prorocentrum cordatum TaxID=2364126 RepID=A0ABN9SYT4_9DINO|nr:unnamed protein product [Polarella glacialis]
MQARQQALILPGIGGVLASQGFDLAAAKQSWAEAQEREARAALDAVEARCRDEMLAMTAEFALAKERLRKEAIEVQQEADRRVRLSEETAAAALRTYQEEMEQRMAHFNQESLVVEQRFQQRRVLADGEVLDQRRRADAALADATQRVELVRRDCAEESSRLHKQCDRFLMEMQEELQRITTVNDQRVRLAHDALMNYMSEQEEAALRVLATLRQEQEVKAIAYDYEERWGPKEYGSWRAGLDGFQVRSARRAEACRRSEEAYRGLERRWAEARERQDLEERRRKEAAERAVQRSREAVEHRKWREDAVLARRAEERARVLEHERFREDCARLRRGLPPNGGAPAAAAAVAASAAARGACVAGAPRAAQDAANSLEGSTSRPGTARSLGRAVGHGLRDAERRKLDEVEMHAAMPAACFDAISGGWNPRVARTQQDLHQQGLEKAQSKYERAKNALAQSMQAAAQAKADLAEAHAAADVAAAKAVRLVHIWVVTLPSASTAFVSAFLVGFHFLV